MRRHHAENRLGLGGIWLNQLHVARGIVANRNLFHRGRHFFGGQLGHFELRSPAIHVRNHIARERRQRRHGDLHGLRAVVNGEGQLAHTIRRGSDLPSGGRFVLEFIVGSLRASGW